MESLYSLVGKQWGVGFGGTIVSYNNSPYRFLQNLSDRTYFMRGSSSEGGYVNWSIRSNNWATPTTGLPWLLSFIADILNGTNNNVLGIANDLSASYVLDGESCSNKSVAAILAHLINVQYWEAFDVKRVKENTSGLSTSMQLTGLPAGESTIAQIARYIHNNLVGSYVLDGETYANKSVAQMLAQVVNSTYWSSDKQSKTYEAFSAWVKSWDSWSARGLSVDTGYIEARLDTIADLMKIGAAKDVVDAIVGDFDSTASAALVGEVQAAASNAFPFCVPALIKHIFGLVQSDPSPPVIDFDIAGQSLHIDCAPMQGFADVLGWACRFLFLFVLVVSTRKFVYTGAAS